MRLLLIQLLLASTLAFANHGSASCQVSDESVVGRSASGIAQVSNLGLIQIRCRVAARPFPSQPGEVLTGLRAQTKVYKISADGMKSSVSSDVNVSGGGSADGVEWVDFYLNIPLDPAERDAEIQRLLANFKKALTDGNSSEENGQHSLERLHRLETNPQALTPMISQYRTGRFRIDCRVLDGNRIIAVGNVPLEVIFKGHFSAAMLDKK